MDFGKAFSFTFQDEEWLKKLAIIGLVALIPFVGWLVLYGWGMQIALKVIRREQEPIQLPRLEFGNQLSLGFKAFLVQLVYAIPLFVLMLPIIIVSIVGESSGMDADTLGIIMPITGCLCGGLAFLYALAMSFMLPMAIGRFLDQGSVGAGLKFGEVFKLVKAALVPDLLAVLGSALGSMIGSLGTAGCGVGVLLTMPYSLAITGHLYGQAYNQAVANKAL